MTSVVSHLANSKTLFIISNSPFWFIDAGMKHLVSNDWRDAFDVVITEARKPSFFLEQKPFLELKEWVPIGRFLTFLKMFFEMKKVF